MGCSDDCVKCLNAVESGNVGQRMRVAFQVAEVAKPLISVKRIIEKGNRVCFGPTENENYIENVGSKERIQLRASQTGSYLMPVQLVGGERVEITVDSGAEENFCPRDWGSQFGIHAGVQKMRFNSASGGHINHYGSRTVVMGSPF